jgi:hypothetical protein
MALGGMRMSTFPRLEGEPVGVALGDDRSMQGVGR